MPYCALEQGSLQGTFAGIPGLTYEIEMLPSPLQLSKSAQTTIICEIRRTQWRLGSFLSCLMIGAIKAHPLRVNFRQAPSLPIATRFKKLSVSAVWVRYTAP